MPFDRLRNLDGKKRARDDSSSGDGASKAPFDQSAFFASKCLLGDIHKLAIREQSGEQLPLGLFLSERVVSITSIDKEEGSGKGFPRLVLLCENRIPLSGSTTTWFEVVFTHALAYDEWYRKSRGLKLPTLFKLSLRGAQYTPITGGDIEFRLTFCEGAVIELITHATLGNGMFLRQSLIRENMKLIRHRLKQSCQLLSSQLLHSVIR